MKRDLSQAEARDEQIAALTERHFTARMAVLCTGEPQAVAAVDEALSHEFCDAQQMHQLIVLAVTEKHQAGAVLESLIHKVVRAAAEVDALREVEQMEQQRKEQADEARADNARWDRAAV